MKTFLGTLRQLAECGKKISFPENIAFSDFLRMMINALADSLTFEKSKWFLHFAMHRMGKLIVLDNEFQVLLNNQKYHFVRRSRC